MPVDVDPKNAHQASSRDVSSSTRALSFEIICFRSDRSFPPALLGQASVFVVLTNEGSDLLLSAERRRLRDELSCLANSGWRCDCFCCDRQPSSPLAQRRRTSSYAHIANTYGMCVAFSSIIRTLRTCSAGIHNRNGLNSIKGMRFYRTRIPVSRRCALHFA